jgi:hypothetical protein
MHLGELGAQLQALARELEEVRRRLDRLEAHSGSTLHQPPVVPTGGGRAALPAEVLAPGLAAAAVPGGALPLVGRTLVVLGGAYLLRAFTDAGLIPGRAGALAGLAYAAAWLVVADRAAAAGRRTSAVFHGFAAVGIAYPLLWETTARFALIAPAVSASALLAFFALGLAVAWRHGLGEVASANVLFAAITAMGLLVRTGDLVTFALVLLLVAAAVEGVAFHDRWLALRWPVAVVLDLAVVLLAMVEGHEGGPPEGYPALTPVALVSLGLGLALLYLAGTSARTLARGRPITPFEVTQTATALVLGYGGATSVLASIGGSLLGLGVLGLLLGAGGYAAAFSFLERRPEFGRNFYAYSTLGGALTLAGTWMLFSEEPLALAWSALAMVALWLGVRYERLTLKAHGALYLVAAAGIAGLIAHASDGLLGGATDAWRDLPPAAVATFVAAAACYAMLYRTCGTGRVSWPRRLPTTIVAALITWSLAGLAAAGLARALGAAPGPAADAAVVAAVRTAVLAGLALVLAWSGRRWSLPELTWLVYPLLGAGALKLLLEDLRQGRPATLFVALALYGGALIATPRLMRND